MAFILHTKERLHIVCILFRYKTALCQAAFLCGSFFCKNVTLVSMFTLDFTRPSDLESLLRAGVGFHLWHKTILVFPVRTIPKGLQM